jgi:hypothetical protein
VDFLRVLTATVDAARDEPTDAAPAAEGRG